jgi:hypothetical protein
MYTYALKKLAKGIRDVQPKIEKRRVKFQRTFLLGITATATILTFVFMKFLGDPYSIYFPVIICVLVISALLLRTLNRNYKKTTKIEFIKGIVNSVGLKYSPAGNFPVRTIEKHLLLPEYNRHFKRNSFKGFYDDVAVEMQEIVLSGKVADDTNASKIKELNSFRGIIIKIRLNRGISGHTVILPSSFLKSIRDNEFSTFSRVKLANDKFKSKYKAVSTDKTEGRMILNSSFLETFTNAGNVLKSRWVGASFMDDEIIILLQKNKPLFKIGDLWMPLTEDHLKKVALELSSMLNIVNALKENPQLSI